MADQLHLNTLGVRDNLTAINLLHLVALDLYRAVLKVHV